MNIRRSPSDDEGKPLEILILEGVDALLQPLLRELYSEVTIVEPADPTRVAISYEVQDFGFYCRIGLAPHNDTAATLTAVICVGRFYAGYRRALRWLANNRASNTVSFTFTDQHAKDSELWLCCTRITTPEDAKGLRAALEDIHHELGMVDAGFRLWFPHVLRGQLLMDWEQVVKTDEDLLLLLANPRIFFSNYNEDNDAPVPSKILGEGYAWLRRWDERLRYINREPFEPEADEEDILWRKARSLLELHRYEEMVEVCEKLESIRNETDNPDLAGARAQALYEKGEYEEVLDLLRSAMLDGSARVCLYRSLAHARLGNRQAAIESYYGYESLVGPDFIAEKMLAELMQTGEAESEM